MRTRTRGRPAGYTGKAPVLKPEEIRRLFRVAKSRPKFALRAEAALAVSLFLGLRAKEIASLRFGDVHDNEGTVRDVLHLKRSYTKGAKPRDVYLSSGRLRQILIRYRANFGGWNVPTAPLFKSQKGQHMTAGSMARFLKQLYTKLGCQMPAATLVAGHPSLHWLKRELTSRLFLFLLVTLIYEPQRCMSKQTLIDCLG